MLSFTSQIKLNRVPFPIILKYNLGGKMYFFLGTVTTWLYYGMLHLIGCTNVDSYLSVSRINAFWSLFHTRLNLSD